MSITNGWLMTSVAVLNGRSQHHDRSSDTAVMRGPEAGQSSYKRDVNHDDVEQSFLRHSSWMDWRHSIPHQRSRTSMLIGS